MTTGKSGSLLCGYKPLLLAGLKVHEMILHLQTCATAENSAVRLHLMREVDFCRKAKRRRERKKFYYQTTPQSKPSVSTAFSAVASVGASALHRCPQDTRTLTSGACRCGGTAHRQKPFWNHLSNCFSLYKNTVEANYFFYRVSFIYIRFLKPL